VGDAAGTVVAALLAGHDETAMLKAPGLSIVLATRARNPDTHSAGRYRLPPAPSIVGALAFEPLRRRSPTVVSLPTAIGAAASRLVVNRFCPGLPPA
jgi:hypothetical protein